MWNVFFTVLLLLSCSVVGDRLDVLPSWPSVQFLRLLRATNPMMTTIRSSIGPGHPSIGERTYKITKTKTKTLRISSLMLLPPNGRICIREKTVFEKKGPCPNLDMVLSIKHLYPDPRTAVYAATSCVACASSSAAITVANPNLTC